MLNWFFLQSAINAFYYYSLKKNWLLLLRSISVNVKLIDAYYLLQYKKETLGLKKNIVCFRFPTDPVKTCETQIYFMDFQKKKKKKKKFFFFFFFFLGNP